MSASSLQLTLMSDILIIFVVAKNYCEMFAHFSWAIVGYSCFDSMVGSGIFSNLGAGGRHTLIY